MKRVLPSLLGLRYKAIIPAASVLAMLGAFALPGTASAATGQSDQIVAVHYPVNGGNLFIKNINTNVAVGSGTLSATLDLDTLATTATLSLPAPTVSFKAFGSAQVSAVLAFVQNGPATGSVDINTDSLTSTASVTVKVLSLKVNGVSLPVGNNCQSATPASVTFTSQPGFDLFNGGPIASTFTIPKFAGHCEAATAFIGHTIPGAGNTITLNLGALALG